MKNKFDEFIYAIKRRRRNLNMLNMSSYKGTLDREVVEKKLRSTSKKIMLMEGFGWKGATPKLVTLEAALKVLREETVLNVREDKAEILLNSFSENDMY